MPRTRRVGGESRVRMSSQAMYSGPDTCNQTVSTTITLISTYPANLDDGESHDDKSRLAGIFSHHLNSYNSVEAWRGSSSLTSDILR